MQYLSSILMVLNKIVGQNFGWHIQLAQTALVRDNQSVLRDLLHLVDTA